MDKRIKTKWSLPRLGAIFLCLIFALLQAFFPLLKTGVLRIENALAYTPPTFYKMAEFSTWYSEKDGGRCANIALAASKINGIILQPYGEFSFNQTVGKRTRSAGFFQAKIIVNGEYVLGVGGGVCQVSTTLYNTALLSGLSIEEAHGHSLQVSYVPPSRDAMVSTSHDLKIFNPHPFPVKFCLSAKNGILTVAVYGERVLDRYKIVSVEKSTIEKPPPIVVDSASDLQERDGKDGLVSEAYLERYQSGVLVERKRLRVDRYAPIPPVVKKIVNTTKKMSANSCFFL
jgi:vancomycin resistance protein YoaR